MVDAFGAVTWWGFSPAIDLQNEDVCSAAGKLSINNAETNPEDMHALLVGAGDSRHIIKTIAHAIRHRKRKLNFYVIEGNHEVLARHLLFLSLCLESPDKMGLQEKTELFLELFGNTLVRQQTGNYLVTKATEFIKMVTDFDYMAEHMPIMDMSALKFKERDHLEAIFKFWRNPDKRIFDVAKFWDSRLRKHLQTRYDSRSGSYDWDYNMKLLDRGANIIFNRDYSKWRETGVAFQVRESTYETPNRTLASGLFVKTADGDRVPQRGYWGDIVSSPYLSFGIECEETSLLKKQNGVYTRSAQHIAEHNLISMLHEITTKERYVMPESAKDDAVPSKPEPAKLEEITEEEEEEETGGDDSGSQDNKKDNNGNKPEHADPILLEDVKVYFLPLGCIADLHKKAKYRGLFNQVYFANSMVHHLTPELTAIFADHTTVLTETARFMVDLKMEQCQEFLTKVDGIATNAGCKGVDTGKLDAAKQSTLKFKFDRKR